MTVRRNANGEVEELKNSLSTNTFRWFILVTILSMHPVGRVFLGQLGFVLPDQAAEKKVQEELVQVKTDVAAVKTDVAEVKKNLDTLTTTVSGFEVNFDRFKKEGR